MSKCLFDEKLWGWIVLSRPSFHTVGILPFILGTVLAWKLSGTFQVTIFTLGILAVILIMLSTYHAGEYYDYEGDVISQRLFRNRFAGGTGVMQSGILSRQVPFWTSLISLLMAGVMGLILQFYFRTGPYTILLGCLGAFPGFYYSTPPIRLVKRGWGEVLIGFCYGWLPMASAFYIQTGHVAPVIHWISIPIGLSIFNVILLNEFSDYFADMAVGKRNLLVRIGKERGAWLYILTAILSWISLFFSLTRGVDWKAFYLFIPVILVSAYLVVMILRQKYEDGRVLERLCGINIAVNLGITAAYILAYLFAGAIIS